MFRKITSIVVIVALFLNLSAGAAYMEFPLPSDERVQDECFAWEVDGDLFIAAVYREGDCVLVNIYVNGILKQQSFGYATNQTIITEIYSPDSEAEETISETNEFTVVTRTTTETLGENLGFAPFETGSGTFTTPPPSVLEDEPVENDGLEYSGNGYYYLGCGGGYYYAPNIFGDLYRSYTRYDEGITSSYVFGPGTSVAAIIAIFSILFGSGPPGWGTLLLTLLGIGASEFISVQLSADLFTYTFDYNYKVRVFDKEYYWNRKITYWLVSNITSSERIWIRKSFNYGFSPSNFEMVKLGIDSFMETHTCTYTNKCASACSVCGGYHTPVHTYDKNCDVCSVCGQSRAISQHNFIWAGTSSAHYKQCTKCGAQKDRDSHSHGSWQGTWQEALGRSVEQRICTICRLDASVQTREHPLDSGYYNPAPSCDTGGYLIKRCTTPGCAYEAPAVFVERLGHKFYSSSCTEAAICTRCGEHGTAQPNHNWEPATCARPETCSVCGETRGNKSSVHSSWIPATCEVPKTCSKCGYREGSGLGHSLGAPISISGTQHRATCTRSGCSFSSIENHSGYPCSKCSYCSHQYTNPCTDKNCNRCGKPRDNPPGHRAGTAATCKQAQLCLDCDTILVDRKAHTPGAAATCTTAQKCTVCGVTIKKELGHGDTKYEWRDRLTHYIKCSRCNKPIGKEYEYHTIFLGQYCTLCLSGNVSESLPSDPDHEQPHDEGLHDGETPPEA